jgi:hypothetical protein
MLHQVLLLVSTRTSFSGSVVPVIESDRYPGFIFDRGKGSRPPGTIWGY